MTGISLRSVVDSIKSAKIQNPEAYLRFRITREWQLGQDTFKLFSVKIKHLSPEFVAQARSLVKREARQILNFGFTRAGDSSFQTNGSISAYDVADELYRNVLVFAHQQGLKINLRITDLTPKSPSEQRMSEATLDQLDIGAFYLS